MPAPPTPPTRYPRPSVTVDLLIFTVTDTDLKVLLIRRGQAPDLGKLALPGGFVDVGDAGLDRPPGKPEVQGEDLSDAALRELGEETGLDRALLRQHQVHLEQLFTFGAAGRDPRTRVISVAYYALVPPDLAPLVRAGDDAAEAGWYSVEAEVPAADLAFDHGQMLAMAVDRIRGKLDYSSIAFSLVPRTFTTSELREVYEAVQGREFDASNFRRRFKRMVTDGILEPAPGKRSPTARGGRPAKVYRFPNPTTEPAPAPPTGQTCPASAAAAGPPPAPLPSWPAGT
jgi:8-oxo-dGTP diphosphatase